jgi:hypothetical protein
MGAEHPISADLLENGEQLTGFMYDGVTDRHYSVADVIATSGLPPEAQQDIEVRIREMVPDAPDSPIRHVSHAIQQRDPEVHYEGQLSSDGQVVEGRWWINPLPEYNMPVVEGCFLLRRSEEGERGAGQASPGAPQKKRPWWRFWG